MKTDPRVDAYIEKSAEFARPMLAKLRADIHAICPQAEEAIKWGAPSFSYKGKNLCGIAAFKSHTACFVQGVRKDDGTEGMGEFGKMRGMADLPSKSALSKLLKARMKMIETGSASPRKPARPAPEVPAEFAKALNASKGAAKTFRAFPPSAQRDYIEWITEAKTDATRARRLAQSVEWISEGKQRNWKYVKSKRAI